MPRAKSVRRPAAGGKAKSKWTPERLVRIPEPYQHALMAFYPTVVEDRYFHVARIPYSDVHAPLALGDGHHVEQVDQVIETLQRNGYVEGPDELGFYALTAAGKALVKALAAFLDAKPPLVPPFPELGE